MFAECLGITYNAEPMVDFGAETVPLEVHIVTFDAPYYRNTHGEQRYFSTGHVYIQKFASRKEEAKAS